MSNGRVYVWAPDSHEPLGGRVETAVVPLPGLTTEAAGKPCLSGRFAHVRNGGWVNVPDANGGVRATAIGNAKPDENGNFIFEPEHGGARMDKITPPGPDRQWSYIQASHFGEVNTYYHLYRIGAYVEELLNELGAPSLPQVVAVVNAHHAAIEHNGIRDGEKRRGRWKAFQGGHYRVPGRCHHIAELYPLAETGEIHLGPGRRRLKDGALVAAFGAGYRANASHIAGTIYHEYGHHILRHTADYRANTKRRPQRQSNAKVALEEGTCDYWTAAMLETPHIWSWHRRLGEQEGHPRSLVSRKTMDDFNSGSKADPHANGTIWAAALWDLRTELERRGSGGARRCDLLVLKTMLLIGQVTAEKLRQVRRLRADYARAAATLLEADKTLYGAKHRDLIVESLSRRRIMMSAESVSRGLYLPASPEKEYCA